MGTIFSKKWFWILQTMYIFAAAPQKKRKCYLNGASWISTKIQPEEWQSGWMHWSWKPAYREVPGVRIPLPPPSPAEVPTERRNAGGLFYLYYSLSYNVSHFAGLRRTKSAIWPSCLPLRLYFTLQRWQALHRYHPKSGWSFRQASRRLRTQHQTSQAAKSHHLLCLRW